MISKPTNTSKVYDIHMEDINMDNRYSSPNYDEVYQPLIDHKMQSTPKIPQTNEHQSVHKEFIDRQTYTSSNNKEIKDTTASDISPVSITTPIAPKHQF
jgi:hypothetical protein